MSDPRSPSNSANMETHSSSSESRPSSPLPTLESFSDSSPFRPSKSLFTRTSYAAAKDIIIKITDFIKAESEWFPKGEKPRFKLAYDQYMTELANFKKVPRFRRPFVLHDHLKNVEGAIHRFEILMDKYQNFKTLHVTNDNQEQDVNQQRDHDSASQEAGMRKMRAMANELKDVSNSAANQDTASLRTETSPLDSSSINRRKAQIYPLSPASIYMSDTDDESDAFSYVLSQLDEQKPESLSSHSSCPQRIPELADRPPGFSGQTSTIYMTEADVTMSTSSLSSTVTKVRFSMVPAPFSIAA
ncbi:hypothetical protein FRC02_001797 [Tulasnella sp. 418]|nr:hypothetical protein FRC02_001797 [Tulasnella sp. 418]